MALTNPQYNQIMRAYEQIRLANRDKQLQRYEEAYKRIPGLQNLEQSISTLSLESARNVLSGKDEGLLNYKKQLHELTLMRAGMLESYGFSDNYLEPIYTCENCQDTGYHHNKKCHCFKKAATDLLYKQSNLQNIINRENFDTFSFDYYSANFIDKSTGNSSLNLARDAVKACHQFIDEFSTQFQNLLILGNTGVGKTFLSNCIARELMENTYSVIYLTASDFFEICKKAAFSRNYDNDSISPYFIECDLLIIDDLGTELNNSLTNSQFFVYLNDRILKRRSTLISTNLSLEDIKTIYSERVFSRITSNYKILPLAGDDIRIQKKLMNKEEK